MAHGPAVETLANLVVTAGETARRRAAGFVGPFPCRTSAIFHGWKMIQRASFDVETRSHCDIARGNDVYLSHHTTELVCADLETDRWKASAAFIPSCDGREALENKMRADGLTVVPPETLIAMVQATKTIVAHNFAFEIGALRYLANVNLAPDRFSCTMARAMRMGLPGGLGNLASVLGFGSEGKDAEGNRLMKQVSKPRPTWTKKQTGQVWFEDADRLARIAKYCADDVRVTRRIDQMIPELESDERAIWLHVHDMNCRGIPVDVEMIHGAITMSEEAIRDVTDRIRHYTGGMVQSLKAPGQLVAWAERYNYYMPSWTKDTVNEALADPNCPEPVRVVALARQEASRGSVAKFEKASEMVSPDGTLKHQLLYAGTSTLRLAGRGVQPLNLPRPKIMADQSAAKEDMAAGRPIRVATWKLDYDPERALAAIKAGDLAALRNMGDPEEILSDNIRSMIAAPAGKTLVSPDLSAIEARGVFWLVNCEKALDVIRKSDRGEGPDIYCQLASTMFGFPVIKKKHPEERQYGKVGILQCFEAGTRVVTRDRGVVSIEQISTEDLVWDGIEWVQHDGVVARGKKHTTNFHGVRVTPDHLVMTRHGWRTVSDLQQKPLQSANDLGIWSSAAMNPDAAKTVVSAIPGVHIFGANVDAENTAPRLWRTLKKVARHVVTSAPTTCRNTLKKWRTDTLRSFLRATTDIVGSGGIARCWHAPISAPLLPQKITYIEASQWRRNGLTLAPFSRGFERNQIGIAPSTVWNGTTSTDLIAPATAALRPLASNLETNADHIASNTAERFIAPPNFTRTYAPDSQKSPYPGSQSPDGTASRLSRINPVDVFDVVNAGPRHRFTIVTPEGFCLLVHNCGYGSGASRVAMANKIDEEMAYKIVQTYRGDYVEVPRGWRELETAAIEAIRNPGYMMDACSGRVHFIYEQTGAGGWLKMRRPSGTWMFMPDAGIDFEGRLFYHSWIKGAWREESIWGGVLINFVVQGMCREIMYGAEMRLAQDPRYDLFLQCYDSLTSAVPVEHAVALCDNMIREMTTPPAWCLDFPLAAEGKPKSRYS